MTHTAYCIAFESFDGPVCTNTVVSSGRLLCSIHIQNPKWLRFENNILSLSVLTTNRNIAFAECRALANYYGLTSGETSELIVHQRKVITYNNCGENQYSLRSLGSKLVTKTEPEPTPKEATISPKKTPPPLPPRSPLVEHAPQSLQKQGRNVAEVESKIGETAEQALSTLGSIVEETGGPTKGEFVSSVETESPTEHPEVSQNITEEITSSPFLKQLREGKENLKPPAGSPKVNKSEAQTMADILAKALAKRRTRIEGEGQGDE